MTCVICRVLTAAQPSVTTGGQPVCWHCFYRAFMAPFATDGKRSYPSAADRLSTDGSDPSQVGFPGPPWPCCAGENSCAHTTQDDPSRVQP